MAINIQEILHPSDSDSIKFEKINYNFDQILANGGGPIGPKGQKGIQGVVGQTGQKGEIGEKGIKGDSGETTSPWKSIAIDLDALDGVNNVTFLKPKPGTDKETPVIWLGDSSFINDGNTAGDGDVTLRSTLNVGRHYNFTGSAIEAEYMTLWHNADNKIVIDSEDQTGYVRYNLSPVNPLVGNAPDIRFQINLPTIHTETFLLNNMGASGTLSDGAIRYNPGGNKFEGYIGGAWKEFCMDPCGSGVTATISISGGDLNLNADGTLSGDSISISGGDLNLNADGTTSGGSTTTSSTTTTTAAPQLESYTINFVEGNSNANFNITGVTLDNGGSSYAYSAGSATFQALPGATVTFTLTADVSQGRTFDNDPITISGTATVSESNTNTQATHQFSEVLGSSGATTTLTVEAATSAIVTTAPAPTEDFDFVSGQVGGGSITNFTTMNSTLNVTNNSNNVALNFERSSSVAQANFSLPSFVTWNANSPLTYNGGTNSGTLNLVVSQNTTSNARNGNVTCNLPVDVGNVGAVTIQQDGTVISGGGGQQQY